MSSFYDYEWATDTLSSARSESAGKPIQNNTRLFRRSDDSIAVKLHAVDVVTINADDTWTLRAGGWHTVTTMQRIRGYSPARLFSIRGEWYVRLAPSEDDPQPARFDRSVPKPFTASDPGPEPVKNDNGCQAGTMIGTEHKDEIVSVWRKDVLDTDEVVKDDAENPGSYDYVDVKRTWMTWIFYGEEAYSYQSKEYNAPETDKRGVTYEQCPHCKAFDAEHERWRQQMHGARWYNRSIDQKRGYATYREMMETYGTQEAWQEAYIADFRERRAYLQAEREWDERNRVPFYDGITVDSSGFAPRVRKGGPSKSKLAKHERKVAKIKKQIDKYVDGFIGALKEGMPMPSGGDCWYCVMRTEDGRTLGDAVQTLHPDGSLTVEENHDHLYSHMEDKYYVPSLAVNALRERGYRDVGIYMWLDMDADTQQMGGGDRYDNVKRDLTKYMSKRLIPAAPTK